MKDLTQGSLAGQMLTLSGTLMIGMIASRMLAVTTMFWVGQLGPSAQAAVALAVNPMSIILVLAPVMGVGSRVLIAHAVGANDRAGACRIFNETFGAALVGSLLLTAAVWLGRARLGAWLTPDRETAGQIQELLRWFIFAVGLQIPMTLMSTALHGTGSALPGTLAQVGSVALSMVLGPVLMFGWLGAPRLGLAGAGLASLISASAAVLGLVIYLAGPDRYLRMQPGIWLSRPLILWQVIRLGSPTGVQSAVNAINMLLLLWVLRPFGPVEQAAYGVGLRIYYLAALPITALGSATSVIAGQSYGARLGSRVKASFRTSLALSALLTPVIWVLAELFAGSISAFFSSDPAVIAGSAHFLRIVSFTLFPLCVLYSCYGVLAGLGNTTASVVTSTGYAVSVMVCAWALSYVTGFDPDWLWILLVLAAVLEMLGGLAFLKAEARKQEPLLGTASLWWRSAV